MSRVARGVRLYRRVAGFVALVDGDRRYAGAGM